MGKRKREDARLEVEFNYVMQYDDYLASFCDCNGRYLTKS